MRHNFCWFGSLKTIPFHGKRNKEIDATEQGFYTKTKKLKNNADRGTRGHPNTEKARPLSGCMRWTE